MSERDELLADAAILDQAVGVLERRVPEAITQDQVTARPACTWVRYAARAVRLEAEDAS